MRSIVLLTCLFLPAAAMFLPAAALAQPAPKSEPKTIDDCERISEALAYNACLAQFGPARGTSPKTFAEPSPDGDTGGGDDGSGDSKATPGKTGKSASLSHDSSFPGHITRNRRGRVSASIDVSNYSGRKSYRHSSSKYRHYRYSRRHYRSRY